jgi:hypothetical protein
MVQIAFDRSKLFSTWIKQQNSVHTEKSYLVQSKIIWACLKRLGPVESYFENPQKNLIAPSNLYARFLLVGRHGLHIDFDKIRILVTLVCSLLLLHL